MLSSALEALSTAPIAPAASESEVFVFPVSFAQQRLWFLEQLDPDSGQYNMATAVHLQGPIHLKLLQQSLETLVERHESLRTRFAIVGDNLMQVIHPQAQVPLTVVDGAAMGEAAQSQAWLVQEAQRPFHLAQAPLLRVTLLQLTPSEQILLLVMHHIISDGWSLQILVRELATVYEAFATEQIPALPELPIQYADFATWQRDWLAQGERKRQLQYWQQQLQGLSPLQLATDFLRPAIASGKGARQTWALSPTLTQGLKQLSQQAQVTLYMTLLAAWQTLLYRYTGQEDIAVGSPIANRNQAETQGVIGCFVNTLVLRTRMPENLAFRQLLQQVRTTVLKAYEHQDLPFETLVEALQPERDLSHNPLAQVWFALNHAPAEALEIQGLTWQSLSLERSTTQFDLSLEVVEQDQALQATIEYSPDLFQAETITRLWHHFQVLLAGVIANPDTVIANLPLLTAAEQQVLMDWNQTQLDFPQQLCIHELFEQQAAQAPEAIAIVDEYQQLTYWELNQQANQLAHTLQQRGVSPEVIVGLCLKRSVHLLVGILGILKAGGAYLPLDPAYPRDRLEFMIQDSQLSLLLTQQDLLEILPPSTAQILCIDSCSANAHGETHSPLASSHSLLLAPHSPAPTPSCLAYIIYTSGSTGRAKGVMIEHRSLVNAYFAWEAAYHMQSEVRCHLQMASFSFDVFTGDWVRALCSGGKLILCPRDALIDPPRLYGLIQHHQIDAAEFVPAVLRPLAQYVREHQQRLDNFKLLVCGSDTWTWQDYQQIRQLCAPTTRLINSFGVTEATIDSSYFEAQTIDSTNANLPIGRPFANTQLYILDCQGQPVPIGVPGELYIGGAGLARGYWQRPKLTAERFVPTFFPKLSLSPRLYKTGDLARLQPNGTLEFWGRADDQVKLRGYRIELGEIETVLSRHPAVQAAIASVYTEQGHKRLVAYVVPQPPSEDCDRWLQDHLPSLQQHLKVQLPDYMVPSGFMALAQLPLTPNGKVDRRSLPALSFSCPRAETSAPQTPTEQTLAHIWAEVLGLPQVGMQDNFFELGGDSILSIQIIAKANQAGLHLTPKQLFQHQTIAELATVAGTQATLQAEQGRVTGRVPLTPIQHWFFEQPWQVPQHWNQSVLLEVRRPLNVGWLKQAMQQLLEHHDLLRSQFWQTEQGWQQAVAETEAGISVTEIDLSALPLAAQIPALTAKATEIQASLELAQGLLLRVALFHLSVDGVPTQRLLIVIHHLVVDGVSWRILLEDLQTAYQQTSQGQSIQLPAKTTSFPQWAKQLQQYAQTAELQQQTAYWQQQLRSPVSSLPLDQTTGVNTVATSQTLSVSLSSEETQILLQEIPKCYHTQINDVLLTALAHSFAAWTGNSTLLVDLEGHGREPLFSKIDVSRTVGWFTSVFPVCLQTAETVQATLKQLKAYLRQIPQNGIGYGLLRYLAHPSLEKSQVQPEVSFNYFGQLDTATSATSLFGLAKEPDGAARSGVDLRTYLLEINSSIVGGQLQLDWSYSAARHQRETIARLAERFLSVLRSLIQERTTATPCYTPSDFPLVALDQTTLDQVIERSQAAQGQASPIESIYPLSPIQQGLLFHLLYNPDSEAYFTQTWGTLVGPLNVAAFQQAWQQGVDQHAILRTAFVWDQLDVPLQVVYRQVTLPFEQQDWRHFSAPEQQHQWQILLQGDRLRGCDPAAAPLMRVTLVQLAEDRYQFIWSHHHLLLDGWSTPLFLKDVLLSYEAYCQNQIPRLSSSPAYGQYIAWLQGRSLEEAEIFWRQTLQGFVQPTPLPTDPLILPGEQTSGEAYAEYEVKLSAETTAALQGFSRQFQITLNTLMQGAWALLLGQASQRQDIIFGGTASGRPTDLPGAEAMIGLFINTLPVRVQIQPDLPLLDWLQALQAHQVEARQYEYSPLAQIQRWSEVPQRVPLFSSVLVFENYPLGADLPPDLQGVQIQAVQSVIRNHYPLTLRVAPHDAISLLWMYDRHQLHTVTVQHRAQQLVELLQAIANQPHTLVQDLLTLLQSSEHQAQTTKAQALDQVSRTSFQRSRRQAIPS